MDFVTNVSWTHGSFIATVSGRVEYDWRLQSQRIEHGPGNIECVKFYQAHTSCTLLTNADGLYRLLPDPAPNQSACCLDMPSIHTPPPEWAAAGSRDGGRLNLALLRGGRVLAQDWLYPSTCRPNRTCAVLNGSSSDADSGCHQYMEGAPESPAAGLPLLFSFPAASGRQDWYFEPNSMDTTPIDPARFALPAGCAKRRCRKEPTAEEASTITDRMKMMREVPAIPHVVRGIA